MVPKGIGNATHAPGIGLIGNRPDDSRTGGHSAREYRVGVVNDEDQANGRATEGFGAEVLVFGRLVSDPKFGAIDG